MFIVLAYLYVKDLFPVEERERNEALYGRFLPGAFRAGIAYRLGINLGPNCVVSFAVTVHALRFDETG
jgi:hypothetical protein